MPLTPKTRASNVADLSRKAEIERAGINQGGRTEILRVKGERRKQKRRDQIKKMDALLKKLKVVCGQTRLAIEESLHDIHANPEKYPDHLDVEQLTVELKALEGHLRGLAENGEARLKRIQVVK